jgi:hypothetical protein
MKVMADRYALLTGQATDRRESRDLTDSFDDHERTRLKEVLRESLEVGE